MNYILASQIKHSLHTLHLRPGQCQEYQPQLLTFQKRHKCDFLLLFGQFQTFQDNILTHNVFYHYKDICWGFICVCVKITKIG